MQNTYISPQHTKKKDQDQWQKTSFAQKKEMPEEPLGWKSLMYSTWD